MKTQATSFRRTWPLLICLFALTGASPVLAIDYSVNRSWTDGSGTASLTGTVSLPAGTYNIRNGAPNPFTAVNLTLTVNGAPTLLDSVRVNDVQGTGEFDIDATASSLTFDALGDGFNPGSVTFLNSLVMNNEYFIGMDGGGAYQLGFVIPQLVIAPQSFPTEFGVVPEPSCAAIACLGGVVATLGRRRRLRGGVAQRS